MGTNNGNVGKKGRSGRKGYGFENAKKHLLSQSYYIANKSLDKEANDISEKEKRVLATEVVKKDLGRNIDVTTAGKELKNYDEDQIKLIAREIANAGTGDKK